MLDGDSKVYAATDCVAPPGRDNVALCSHIAGTIWCGDVCVGSRTAGYVERATVVRRSDDMYALSLLCGVLVIYPFKRREG